MYRNLNSLFLVDIYLYPVHWRLFCGHYSGWQTVFSEAADHPRSRVIDNESTHVNSCVVTAKSYIHSLTSSTTGNHIWIVKLASTHLAVCIVSAALIGCFRATVTPARRLVASQCLRLRTYYYHQWTPHQQWMWAWSTMMLCSRHGFGSSLFRCM